MRRARLLKVVVQANFVIDDDDTLLEVSGPAVEIPATQWATFAATAFNQHDLEQILLRFDEANRNDQQPEEN